MLDLIDPLVDPLRYPEFLPGLTVGLVALAAGVLAGALGRRPAPVAGALIVGAVVAGFLFVGLLSTGLMLGLVLLLAAAGLWGPPGAGAWPWRSRDARARPGPVAALRWGLVVVVAAAGLAALTEQVGPPTSAWRIAVTVGGIAVTAGLVEFDRRSPHAGLAPVLVLMTAGGIYATVPDTEEARVVLAVALPLAALGWPWRLARLGPTGALLLGGVLTWVAATGGHGRPGSIVGALAAAGLFLACPAARAIAGGSLLDRVPPTATAGVAIAVGQLALALTASRVAGLREGAVEAALIAAPVLVLATVLLAVAAPRRVTPPTG